MRAKLLCYLALALLTVALPARAENWVVSYHGSASGLDSSVDVDSVEAVGQFLRYRVRSPRGRGFAEEVVVANCRNYTRGVSSGDQMYPVYPDTRNWGDVAMVCALAAKGLPSREPVAPTPPQASLSGNHTSEWLAVSSDGMRQVQGTSLRTQRPLVSYHFRYGDGTKNSIVADRTLFAVEVDCDKRLRRDVLLVDGASPRGQFASVDGWGTSFGEEMYFVCHWAEAEWEKEPKPAPPVVASTARPVESSTDSTRAPNSQQKEAEWRECYARVPTRPDVAPLVGKIAVTGDGKTSLEMQHNQARPNARERAAISLWKSYTDACHELTLAWMEALNAAPWFRATIRELKERNDALVARLYGGEFTFGQYNIKDAALAAEFLERIRRGEPTTPAPAHVSSSGSGFFVDTRSVVTNFHVVDGCTHFEIRRDATTYPATLQATTARNDLALLNVQGVVAAAPSIRGGAALGEDVMVAGHPLSGLLATDLIVTSGQVNSLAGLGNDPTLLQISAPVQPGNSGGPLIDRSGSIVGVVVSKVNVTRLEKITGDVAQNLNFAIKPEVLRMFLEANRVSYKSSSGGKHLEGVALAERARAFTVQVLCEN
jgi:S1-C subfamily serine protease